MQKKIISDKRISLILFSVIILSYSFVCMTKYCFASAMVFIETEGYMTNFQTGLINSAFWLVYAITQLFGGAIADKWHPERLVTIGLLGAGIANVAISFCYENYVLTLAIWMLNALCQFGVWPSVFKIITTMYSGNKLTTGMMIATLASPAGQMMSYAVAAIVPRWQDNFAISYVGLFLLAIAWETTSRCSGSYIRSLNLTESQRKKKVSAEKKQDVSLAKLIVTSGLIFIFSLAFLRAMIEYVKNVVPSMVESSYEQVDPVMSTLMSLIPLLCGAAAPIFSSVISKKIDNEMKVVTLIFSAMLPISLITLLIGKINYWWIIIAMAFVTFGAGCATFFITTLIASKFNKWDKGATVAGLLNAFTAIGNVAASAIITWIADNMGWTVSLIAMIVMIAAAFVMAIIEMPIWKGFKNKYYNA